jgi:signal transduction histidine kinase
MVIALAGCLVAASFVLDLLVPGYAIAGFYLLPLMLVAFALHERLYIGIVGLVSVALTIGVMVLQHRVDGQNVLVVFFGVLAGAGLIALGHLYNRFDRLYESERSSNARLQSLTAQLQGLQEAAVLGSERPLGELLHHIVEQAMQLLGADAGALFRLDTSTDSLSLVAAAGLPGEAAGAVALAIDQDPVGRAVSRRRSVAVPDLDDPRGPVSEAVRQARSETGFGACLAVPLAVREDLFGAVALYFRETKEFNHEDVGLAQSFGDQAALAIENTRLREQVGRTAAAAERSRLARDLHDSVTQSLFAAKLQAEALVKRWRPQAPEARESLDDLQRLTRAALAEMRTLLLEMRPAALADAWLGDLLRHLADASEGRTSARVELTVDGRHALPSDVTVALYRVAQEAMNNVIRHAGARRAWLDLRCVPGAVVLVIGDDGRGFDPTGVGPEQFGLRTMRERAEAVGAALTVGSRLGHGTVVTVEWRDTRG